MLTSNSRCENISLLSRSGNLLPSNGHQAVSGLEMHTFHFLTESFILKFVGRVTVTLTEFILSVSRSLILRVAHKDVMAHLHV